MTGSEILKQFMSSVWDLGIQRNVKVTKFEADSKGMIQEEREQFSENSENSEFQKIQKI